MEASSGLVSGSHNRNEFVFIRRDGEPGSRQLLQQTPRAPDLRGRRGGSAPMGSPSSPATSVPYLSVGTATSSSDARARRTSRSARPDSRGSRVCALIQSCCVPPLAPMPALKARRRRRHARILMSFGTGEAGLKAG